MLDGVAGNMRVDNEVFQANALSPAVPRSLRNFQEQCHLQKGTKTFVCVRIYVDVRPCYGGRGGLRCMFRAPLVHP